MAHIAISVSPSVIVPGGDLKISWKTTHVSDGQKGRVNEFPDRVLGFTLSPAAVSGAFTDEDGQITGTPKTDPFAKQFPLSGSTVWKSSQNISGEYVQKMLPGKKYVIQFVLFPKCLKIGTQPCDWELDNLLFIGSKVFAVEKPAAPSNLTATGDAKGAATFKWIAPTDLSPASYSIRIQDNATGKIIDHKLSHYVLWRIKVRVNEYVECIAPVLSLCRKDLQ